ncbi:helix-turn-helix transcriptional regulator [Flavobacterium cerinum]|uniref:AraC family transcriptional regulator n=1 Tax=Flavobacterium cerinum TaxID=2502784 RepID=A0ABY5IN07_9FLAO|nr:AraC family transcriptional regulator [Flavobacterium cerinum]UUC44217.1 AraC family transcriptional regulator [Flavobacterium cerinum]
MKKITHHYGIEPDWVTPLALQLEGEVDGNFIRVPDHIHSGIRYFLNCNSGITALYIDVVYNTEIHFRQQNLTNDFLGIYYNLTEGEAVLLADNTANPVGRWDYNLAIVDAALSTDYIVKPGSRTYVLCIFIKKELIKEYMRDNPSLQAHVDSIMDAETNTVIRFTRMPHESFHLLNDLRTQTIGTTSFDYYLQGTIQSLLADYIEKMTIDDIVIGKVGERDLNGIVKSQSYLVNHLEETFPGIDFLAAMACMSPAKYKSLFKKITGIPPNTFFLNNKLVKARLLLQQNELPVDEIARKLHFTNSSYFILKFRNFFGLSPKAFIKQLY